MHTGLIIIYFTKYLRRQLVINKSCLEFLIKKMEKGISADTEKTLVGIAVCEVQKFYK